MKRFLLMIGTNNLNKMAAKRFVIAFVISFVVYVVLDFALNYSMIYITGGLIGGTISEIFKIIGVNIGIVSISLIWVLLAVGIIALFYRLKNQPLKYFIVALLVALLYVVDIFIGEAGITFILKSEDEQQAAKIGKIILWTSTISRSLVLTLIIYFDRKRLQSLREPVTNEDEFPPENETMD